MSKFIITTLMLVCSNVFMTFAWYGHLRNYNDKPWIVAAVISWGIALFEYLLQVPANRIGHHVMSLGQLIILQEVITLSVFVPFLYILYEGGLKKRLPMGSVVHLGCGFLCVPGFISKSIEVTSAKMTGHNGHSCFAFGFAGFC
jgi:uncharacterized protein